MQPLNPGGSVGANLTLQPPLLLLVVPSHCNCCMLVVCGCCSCCYYAVVAAPAAAAAWLLLLCCPPATASVLAAAAAPLAAVAAAPVCCHCCYSCYYRCFGMPWCCCGCCCRCCAVRWPTAQQLSHLTAARVLSSTGAPSRSQSQRCQSYREHLYSLQQQPVLLQGTEALLILAVAPCAIIKGTSAADVIAIAVICWTFKTGTKSFQPP